MFLVIFFRFRAIIKDDNSELEYDQFKIAKFLVLIILSKK